MDVSGNDLLAGTTLTLNQHRRIGWGHVLGQLEHVHEPLGLADGPRDSRLIASPDLLLELGVLDLYRAIFAGAPENGDQFVVGERLLDIVESARVYRADGTLKRGLRGHQYHRRHRVLLSGSAENIQARHLWHAHIREDDVVGTRADLLQPGFAALGRGDLEAFISEQDSEGIENPRLVVDDQHRRLLTHAASSATILAGKNMVNVVPDAGPESTNTRPRCASTAR